MARKRKGRLRAWAWRAAALLVLAGALWAGWQWWAMQDWRPSEETYPDQGVALSDHSGQVRYPTLAALGARFAYVAASEGEGGRDLSFARHLRGARAAGLRVGAVHGFDPCVRADGQSANFSRVVPRDADLLPPVIALDRTAQDCPERVSDAAVESELLTLVNQIELHAGRPAILKISERFEQEYGLAGALERDLWLVRNRFAPDYAGRPWLLWTANRSLKTEASEEPLEWVVVRR